MSKLLRLYNSFSRSINNVEVGGKLVAVSRNALASGGFSQQPTNCSLYICGPTVYSDSHLGHALTYVRADLFRRFLKSIFNLRLVTVMNITDIDDKILAKSHTESGASNSPVEDLHQELGHSTCDHSDPFNHPFRKVSEKYYKSFLQDMEFVRVAPPDLTVKVTGQIQLIMEYIRDLERKGHAYYATNGDVYFNVASVKSYVGRVDARKDNTSESKSDARDFVLWKAAKPGEPVWHYRSSVSGKTTPGRPGWHVQCSAISSAIFGKRLDFHFGGKDLIFPHHYNEEACSCAYHNLDTSKTMHVWSKNWLHSGHLILREDKMSKSIGNVVAIRTFITDTSVNALRLLCVSHHYRSDVEFSKDLLSDLKSLDHKLGAFCNYLSGAISNTRENRQLSSLGTAADTGDSIERHLAETYENIIDGVCDDFDLKKGLKSILDLSKLIYSKGAENLGLYDLIGTWSLLRDWCDICRLEYGPMSDSHDECIVSVIQNFRQSIRNKAISGLKNTAPSYKDETLKSVLAECDNVRSQMDELGYVLRDTKT